jgi:sugar lactone lactonase YvrE
VALPGTLAIDNADVEQGTVLTFTYTVSADKASDKNWVGIWPDPGNGPVGGEYAGASTTWAYAPGQSGSVAISSGILKAGSYLAFYLYDDGYSSLAEPVSLQVRNAPQLPAPPYRGQFGEAGPHPLETPAGMTVDRAGRFWVADPAARRVHVFSAGGRPVASFGEQVLRDPQDVAVGTDSVYVADRANNRVERFDLRGRHTGSLGDGDVDLPRGVAVGPRGRVLVADVGNNRVARYDPASGRLVGEISDGVHIPHGILAQGDRVWVVSSSRQYDGNPGVTCYVGDQPTITLGYGQHSVFGALSNPAHVALDRSGLVLVSVPDFGFVSRFRQTGAFVGEFGTAGRGLLRFPQGVVLGRDGDVYVADTGNGRIVRFGGSR